MQRKITLFIYEFCKASRSKISNPLSIEHISSACQTTKFSVQKTIQRLETKKILSRNSFKNGRGGWTQYELFDSIFQEIMHEETQNKLRINLGQTQDKPETELRTELRTNLFSSSGNEMKTTTTGEMFLKQKINNLEIWKKLDIEPLISIGFSQTHLLQIANQSFLEPNAVQESIYAFAFDLEQNHKAKQLKKSPLEFFMGILRNGSVYAPPLNYKSPKEIALEAFIQQRNRVQELEEKAINIEFQLWAKKLTSDEKNQLVPEETRKTGIQALTNQALKTHFKEKIWPDIAQQVCV